MANGIPGACCPELTRYGGGPLTSSKYFGTPGLDALRAMLQHADRYGLKWVFVRDPYYDPLLSFAGWRRVDESGRQDYHRVGQRWGAAGHASQCAADAPCAGKAFCGVLSPSAAACSPFWCVLIPEKRRGRYGEEYPYTTDENLLPGRLAS